MNHQSAIGVAILVILFAWLGYAYYKGPSPEIDTFLLHPLVALILFLLIRSGWQTTEKHTVWVAGAVLLGIWLFRRMLNTLMPFVIGLTVAYLFYLLADFFNMLAVQMSNAPLLQPSGQSRIGRWYQKLLVKVHILVPCDEPRSQHLLTPTTHRTLTFLARLRLVLEMDGTFQCSRWLARLFLLALLVGTLLFFALHVGPQMREQSIHMKDGLITFYDEARTFLVHKLEKIQEEGYSVPGWVPLSMREPVEQAASEIAKSASTYVSDRIPDIAKRGSDFATFVLNGLSSVVTGAIGTVATGVLALMVFAYTVGSFREYMRKFLRLFPENQQETIKQYFLEIDANMKTFLRGQLLVIALVGILSMIVYSIIGVPFAVVVGLLAGVSNAIPTFGPYIGGLFAVLALLMGLASGNYAFTVFLGKLVMTIGAMFGVQMIDNSLISPRVMSSAVDVDPLLIMFSVIFGASLIGFWGVLLAIPGIVVIKSVIHVSRNIRTGHFQE